MGILLAWHERLGLAPGLIQEVMRLKTQRATPRLVFHLTCHGTRTERAVPLTFLYPEFAAKIFEPHGIYVEQIRDRHFEEFLDLVRRNRHQAQQRRMLK